MNQVKLTGKVVGNTYVSGTVTRFKLSTMPSNGRKKAVFVPVVAFGLSDAEKNQLKPDVQITVEGIVAETSFEKNGSRIYQTSVQVEREGVRIN